MFYIRCVYTMQEPFIDFPNITVYYSVCVQDLLHIAL